MARRPALWGVVCILGVLGYLAPTLPADDVEAVKARIAAAGDADTYDADIVVVLDATDVTVRSNGIGVARRQRVTKVLRDGGIRGQSVQQFTFDPHTNRLDLIAIRVYRADGSVEEILIDSSVDQPQPSHLLYWGSQQRLVQVPRLAVGDAVETVSVLTGFNVAYLGDGENVEELNAYGEPLRPPVTGHWHDEAHFWSGVPIIEKRYSVRVPKDKPLQYEIYNGEVTASAAFDGDHVVYTFVKKDITPFKGEPSMEPRPNVAPKLLLATLPDWKAKGRWLHSVSEPQLVADDAIRAKVAEVIKDCKTDEEKYTALNHWVAEYIRYSGTTRGMAEGYTIHDIKETFRDRCGVCKDKAGMLCGMLRVAGFESYTVMTMARQRVDYVPADQFNHCVTCIREKDGSLTLLDPTWMVKSRDNWSKLEPLQHVVYGTPEGVDLLQSPYYPPEDNLASWRAATKIAANGHLTGSLDFTSCGAPEGRLRRTLSGLRPSESHRFFDRSITRLSPNAEVVAVTHTRADDFSRPMDVKCDFAADRYAIGDGDFRYFALPMLGSLLGDRTLYDLEGKTSLKERKYGISLLATRLARFEETIQLPNDWTVVEKPEPVEIDGPSASLHFEIETVPGQIRYTCELSVKHWTIPPDEYANFKEVMDKFEELTGRTIACKLEASSVRR